jgi:hypothetical protein
LAALPLSLGRAGPQTIPKQNQFFFIRHAVHLSLSFAALCTHSLGVGILPMSYPSVYNIYAPYHRRGLMARAFLFFDGQVQSRLRFCSLPPTQSGLAGFG